MMALILRTRNLTSMALYNQVDDMVIHVKMNYVLGDGTRQTEKNKTVAITKGGN